MQGRVSAKSCPVRGLRTAPEVLRAPSPLPLPGDRAEQLQGTGEAPGLGCRGVGASGPV